MQESTYISPRNVKPVLMTADQCEDYLDLKRIGIDLRPNVVRQMNTLLTQDSLESLVTTPSITTPVQFLQNWLPGNVRVITAALRIDDFVGISVSGAWEFEEIVQGIEELTGTSIPYTDFGNLPESSWNLNFERRTIVRFLEGMRVGILEEARAAAIRMNSAQSKRDSGVKALEIRRNAIGFNGFNNGNNRTYGFLNDPGLPAYVPIVGPAWSDPSATFLTIVTDLLTVFTALRTDSQDQIDPATTPTTLALATAIRDRLSTVSQFGNSVMQWLNETYPKCRVVSAPELNGANASANAGYLYAENIADNGTDDGAVFIQSVPTKFIVTGVEKGVTGYKEGYSNATAGVMCKRPWAVQRFSGM